MLKVATHHLSCNGQWHFYAPESLFLARFNR